MYLCNYNIYTDNNANKLKNYGGKINMARDNCSMNVLTTTEAKEAERKKKQQNLHRALAIMVIKTVCDIFVKFNARK